jgi:hypothetical protein
MRSRTWLLGTITRNRSPDSPIGVISANVENQTASFS